VLSIITKSVEIQQAFTLVNNNDQLTDLVYLQAVILSLICLFSSVQKLILM
jgi:hypothetical protein